MSPTIPVRCAADYKVRSKLTPSTRFHAGSNYKTSRHGRLRSMNVDWTLTRQPFRVGSPTTQSTISISLQCNQWRPTAQSGKEKAPYLPNQTAALKDVLETIYRTINLATAKGSLVSLNYTPTKLDSCCSGLRSFIIKCFQHGRSF